MPLGQPEHHLYTNTPTPHTRTYKKYWMGTVIILVIKMMIIMAMLILMMQVMMLIMTNMLTMATMVLEIIDYYHDDV